MQKIVLVIIFLVNFGSLRVGADIFNEPAIGNLTFGLLAKNLNVDSPPVGFSTSGNRGLLTINHPPYGSSQVKIRFPNGFKSEKRYPVIFFFGGHQTGENVIDYIGDSSNAVFVGFRYPFSKYLSDRNSEALKAIYQTPLHVVSVLHWINRQVWADSKNIAIVGVSLGALYLPVSQRLAELQGIGIHASVIAYGGADLAQRAGEQLLPFIKPEDQEGVIKTFSYLFYLFEPSHHIHSIRGDLLFINGRDDKGFNRESAQKLYDLCRGPKEIIWLEGGHINTDKPKIISEVNTVVAEWFRKIGFNF